jgi:hypothetical protein
MSIAFSVAGGNNADAGNFGYSLNGKEFLVASGGNLSAVHDAYGTTSMSLGGVNGSDATTYDGRLVSKEINTGWTDKAVGQFSDVLPLWGMEDVGQTTTAAPFTLTMSYSDGGYMAPFTFLSFPLLPLLRSFFTLYTDYHRTNSWRGSRSSCTGAGRNRNGGHDCCSRAEDRHNARLAAAGTAARVAAASRRAGDC